MRVNWKSPLVQAVLILLAFGSLTVLWPVAAYCLLHSLPGRKHDVPGRVFSDDNVEIAACFAIMAVGTVLGIYLSMMITDRTVWLQRRKRNFFLSVSGLFALLITWSNSTAGSVSPIASSDYPLIYKMGYLLAVQALPLLWFLYNLHGASWLKTLARRRARRAQ